jgi:sporulation protein YlmC with PRC-barrel domain
MKRMKILALAAAALGLTSVLAAQDPGRDRPGQDPRQEKGRPVATPQGEARAAIANRPFVDKASDLTDSKIVDATGKEIGDIEDLVVNTSNGQIALVILEADGRTTAAPWSLVQRHAGPKPGMGDDDMGKGKDHRRFVLQGDAMKLQSAPELTDDARLDGTWVDSVNKHFGAAGAMAGAATFARTSDLRGKDVVGSTGEELGEIEELAIDTSQGRVAYFVLASGGVLGMGEDRYAIPFEVAKFEKNAENKLSAKLSIDQQKLETAPRFDDDDWLVMSNPIWVREVYTFYAVRPYWSQAQEAGYEKPMKKGGDMGGKDKDKEKKEKPY